MIEGLRDDRSLQKTVTVCQLYHVDRAIMERNYLRVYRRMANSEVPYKHLRSWQCRRRKQRCNSSNRCVLPRRSPIGSRPKVVHLLQHFRY